MTSRSSHGRTLPRGDRTELILLVRESDKIRPQVITNLSSLGYKIIEIKDFMLQELETVKMIID